jgi:hypothetical protein
MTEVKQNGRAADAVDDAAAAVGKSVNEGGYDFIDFGCSKGGSIQFAQRALGGSRGIGIDIDAVKVEQARAAGFNAVLGDVTKVPSRCDVVRFCTMLHFLEHLPTRMAADKCIKTAVTLSRDFVYIRQPWFEGGASLIGLGYKFYWADWPGHPNHFTAIDFINVLGRLERVRRYLIFGRTRIRSTRDAALVPLSAPKKSHADSEQKIAAREKRPVPGALYHEIVCLVQIGEPQYFEAPLSRIGKDHELIFDSAPAPHRRWLPSWRALRFWE